MLRKTVLVRALTIAFGAAAMSAAVVPAAMAQSNAAGNIFGRVDAPAGASVVMQNTDTGAKRTISPDASGRYNATAMSPGHYKVELVRDGKTVDTREVDVIVGQGVDASFVQAIQAVQVTGMRNRIDVSNSNNGATFTAKELARLPIPQTVDAIIQLAPNTTRADSRYAAGASFGGGGASENAYYINGFPVTNPLTQLGASELPFGAIAQAQILTGGFGAEFGRSVGGVVNITTKSGTNNWEAGASASIEPNSLRSKARDAYYPVTGAVENGPTKGNTDGTLFRRNQDNSRTDKIYGAYVGGPLIKDTLFMFISAETRRYDREGTNATLATKGTSTSTTNPTDGWEAKQDKTDRYMAKFDWNISDNHRLEATFLGDTAKTDRQLYGYDYKTFTHGNTLKASQHYKNDANFTPTVGANSQILRYTGNFTEDLTVTALFGQSKTKNGSKYDVIGTPTTGDLYQVSASAAAQAPGLNYTTTQVLSGLVSASDSSSKIKSARLDLEYKLGKHTLRGGLDDNKLTSEAAGEVYGGGGLWTYFRANNPTAPISLGGGYNVAPASFGGLGTQGYYVSKRIFDDTTSAGSDQSAQYLEDIFQVTKDVRLTFGLRNESFKNKNGDGVTFLEVKNFIQPRFGAAWDVNGDASMKVFGSAGRYALQIPTHLAVRGASRSLNVRQYFTYTGTDAQGQPTGLKPMTGVFSTNNELGQAKDPATLTAVDIDPTYQDEITLGFERAFSPSLNFGAKVTYRKLKATIDDYCDDSAILAWATRNKVNTDNYGGFNCASFNPGQGNTFLVDFAGTGKNYSVVSLTAEELKFDKAARTYTALDLFAEHPFRNGWYGRVNYTWSRSRGNTEGQTRSDNAQTDVAATSTWDNWPLMVGANGLLPNDREHQIKAFGFYEVMPQLTLGGNFLAASGRPRSCFGNSPNIPANIQDYGSVYFYCDKPVPRGTLGRLPWDVRTDMNLVFRPAQAKGLALKLDIFNVFNKQTEQTIDETYNLNGTTISSTYGRVISYTAPRSVKFTAEYNYKF
ncbi:TonB-dependent receptor [Pseudoduganella aquatica]|uniref:TonB-dependent receptor plug domain-containing protein n=1 Tax=Pseudoduganella aquatica TaxID=2660641 RepID=A0A7X4HF45_9BURK|nr:TonB-dependent receptor [Pseudoduganella aquatica]MYN09005.1 TonB-dependent receptor plug domain-containing protein [Pseudoduganella aquatica]